MNRIQRSIAACLALMAQASVLHAACTDVIALSKVSKRTISDKAEFEKATKEFCDERSKNKAGASGTTLGVQYSGVGVNLGQSNAKAEAIASRLCEAVSNEKSKSDAYKQYVEDMAEGTYPAYEKCIEAEAAGIRYAVAATAKKMTITVVNGSKNKEPTPQTFTFSEVGDGLSCGWQDRTVFKKSPLEVAGNGNTLLECLRSDASKPVKVVVVPKTRSDISVDFSWPAYKGEDTVDELSALQARVANAEGLLGSMQSGVVAFNRDSCPDGWKAYEPAYGMFIRGQDLSAKKIDPDGKRALNAEQKDSVGKHSHDLDKPSLRFVDKSQRTDETDRLSIAGPGIRWLAQTGAVAVENPDLGSETRPKNIALLYCAKE